MKVCNVLGHLFQRFTSITCRSFICPMAFDDSEISSASMMKWVFDSEQSLEELPQVPVFLDQLRSCYTTVRD